MVFLGLPKKVRDNDCGAKLAFASAPSAMIAAMLRGSCGHALLVLVMLVSCKGEQGPPGAPPKVDEVVAALKKDPEFMKSVSQALAQEPAGPYAQLRDMATCLTDVRSGKSRTYVSALDLERCGRVGLGKEQVKIRPHATEERLAECWKSCSGLRSCMNAGCGEHTCFNYNGSGVFCGRTVKPRIAAGCRKCRNEAKTVRENLGLADKLAP